MVIRKIFANDGLCLTAVITSVVAVAAASGHALPTDRNLSTLNLRMCVCGGAGGGGGVSVPQFNCKRKAFNAHQL